MPEVLLVRHCQSTGQAPDAPLSDRGYEQAEELALLLEHEPIDRIISSPFRRARETIAPLAQRKGLEVVSDPRLAEHRLSDPSLDNWREFVQRSFTDPDTPAPGGDSPRETKSRGRAALEQALAAGDKLPLLVSHGQLLSLVLHSLDPSFGYSEWEAMRNPDVFRVSVSSEGSLRFDHWTRE